MDLAVLKKKLTSYKKPNGVFKNISGEMLIAVLRAWENYTGPQDDFGRQIGVRQSQLGPLIHRARKIAKTTEYADGKFKEVRTADSDDNSKQIIQGRIELIWDNKLIKFSDVETLVEFLRKIA